MERTSGLAAHVRSVQVSTVSWGAPMHCSGWHSRITHSLTLMVSGCSTQQQCGHKETPSLSDKSTKDPECTGFVPQQARHCWLQVCPIREL